MRSKDTDSDLVERITDAVMAAVGATVAGQTAQTEGHRGCCGGGGCGADRCGGCSVPGRCVVVCPDLVEGALGAGADRLSSAPGIGVIKKDLAHLIDHTLLKPDATKDEVRRLCAEAVQYGFYSVCVNPCWVTYCAGLLRGHPVKVCAVIGFPLGATLSEVKAAEAALVVAQGATECDMVVNVGALRSEEYRHVEDDIRAVVGAAHPRAILKVILETSLLDDRQKVIGCEIARRAGADFVKTSTGFSTGGATAQDIALMRRVVGGGMGVKASGGVRDTATAQLMVKAGASRIGASASIKIVAAGAAAEAGKGY